MQRTHLLLFYCTRSRGQGGDQGPFQREDLPRSTAELSELSDGIRQLLTLLSQPRCGVASPTRQLITPHLPTVMEGAAARRNRRRTDPKIRKSGGSTRSFLLTAGSRHLSNGDSQDPSRISFGVNDWSVVPLPADVHIGSPQLFLRHCSAPLLQHLV